MGKEKTGFVYIWYDRLRKMYYIGCHVGDVNDGYICSSNRMRDAYRRRPKDFKRRILKADIPKSKLLEEEHKWLSLIDDVELGYKYYNHSKHRFGHWSNTPQADSIRKICVAKTKPTLTPEELIERGRRISEAKAKRKQERINAGLPARQPNSVKVNRDPDSEETKRKKSEAMKTAWKEGRNTGATGLKFEWSEERKLKHKESVQGCHSNRNPEKYSTSAKEAWREGKFSNRKSNNMKNYIWVRRLSDNSRTRIPKEKFDPTLHILGR